MAEISKLSRLLNGIQRQVDLASNTLVTSEVKIGGGTGTILTKTDLDTLIGGAADASALHNHDGRYFTQTQLGSTTGGSSGASLIGTDSAFSYANIATPANVQDAIQKLDTALSTAGATEFADDVFRVIGNVDSTKKLAFEVDGLSTATTRTWTIQDKDGIVASTSNETFSGTTTVDLLRVNGQAYSPIQSQSASADSTINWSESNVQQITLDQASTTLVFSGGLDGGQYLLIIDQDGVGGRSVTFPGDVSFIGPAPSIQSGANERTIVSFFYDPSKVGAEYQGLSSNDIVSMANGGTGANLSPAAGAVVYSDANSMELSAIGSAGQVLQSGGTGAPSWLTLSGGNGVAYDGAGSFSVDLSATPGLEFATGKLQVLVDPAGAILRQAAGLSANVDASTIEIAANALQVKADGINSSHIQLANNTALISRNAANTADIELIKADAADDIVFASLPKDATVPTDAAHLTNKAYVDAQVTAAASGLDPKESVRFGSIADISGTYSAVGGSGGTGSFTGVDLTSSVLFDLNGGTVAINDRILVKNQTDAKQNGIYVVTTAGATGVIERASDQDGSPANEVSGGNFTFIENGASLSGSGWVVVGDGILTLNTDALSWTQFSATGAFTGGDGIDITSNVIKVDLAAASGLAFATGKLQVDLLSAGGLKLVGNQLSIEPADFAGEGLADDGADNLKLDFAGLAAATADAADLIAFHDATDSTHKKITYSGFLDGLAGAGLIRNANVLDVQTGDGIQIVSDAVAFDLGGIVGSATGLEATDTIAISDASAAGANAQISIANIMGDGLGLTASKIAVQLETLGGIEMDTAADLKLAFDVLAAETVIAAGDFLAFADISVPGDGDHKKITLANMLTQIAGAGLGLNVDKLDVKTKAAGGIQITADELELDINGLAAETVIADGDELAFYDVSAGAHKKITRGDLLGDLSQISETMTVGETFEANTVHAVRMAVSTETAERIYKADTDASVNDNFYVIGLAVNDTASAILAGSTIKVIKLGAQALQAGDLTLVAGDIGKPFYLADGAGNLTLTPPSAANQAVVKLGTIRNNVGSIVEVQIQVMGIN